MSTFNRAALALLAAAILPGLGACSQANDDPADVASSDTAQGPTVSNARVVLAAVAGNPAAAYFDLSYSGEPGVSLIGVEVEGAGMTMIHDYAEDAGKMKMVMAEAVPLTAEAPVSFAPGGLHIMAMDPGADLKPGSTAKLTLIFSDNTTKVVDAPVRAAGEDR